jgi:hypothetical protein
LLMTQHELLSKGNTRYDVSSVAEQDKYWTCNVTLGRVRVTIVAVEQQ